jgi:hypothetical protein
MASISHDGKGYRRLLFIYNSKRSAIRLGKMSLKSATTVKDRIEAIIEAKNVGRSLDTDTAEWLRNIDDDLYAKLADKGLAPARGSAVQSTLAGWIDRYLAMLADNKNSTHLVYGHTKSCLIEYFGAGKPMANITAFDAKEWRAWLAKDQELGETRSAAAAESPSNFSTGLLKPGSFR